MVWQGSYLIFYYIICLFLNLYMYVYVFLSALVHGAKITQMNAKDFIWNTKYMLSDDVGLLGCVK